MSDYDKFSLLFKMIKKATIGAAATGAVIGTYYAQDYVSKSFTVDWLTKVENNSLTQNKVLGDIIEIVNKEDELLKSSLVNVKNWSKNITTKEKENFSKIIKDQTNMHLWSVLIGDYLRVQEVILQVISQQKYQEKVAKILDNSLRGYLSIELFTPRELEEIIDNIKTEIKPSHLELALENVEDYYKLPLDESSGE